MSRLPLIRTAPGVPPHAPMLIPKGMSSFFPSPLLTLPPPPPLSSPLRVYCFVCLGKCWLTAPPPHLAPANEAGVRPAGQVHRSNSAEPHVFYKPCGGTRGGRTLMEATGGCGNVCRNACGYLTLKSNTCKMRNFSCREKINIIDP